MNHATALFQSYDPAQPGWSLNLQHPVEIWQTHRVPQVRAVLQAAEQAAAHGKWVAVMVTYEAAPAFDPVLATHAPSDFPLAWAAAYDEPEATVCTATAADYRISRWLPRITPDAYAASIRKIRHYIEAGDTYQVNFTFPLRARFEGNPHAWFADLCRAQRAAYTAFFDIGQFSVLCLSPELFLQRIGDRLLTRPMKGTMRRGRWNEEDSRRMADLQSSPKNRAENLMIVDLLRNDLGHIAIPGSVVVPSLFTIERLAAVLQMTSTVEARCSPDMCFADIVAALFPCGSITGAPKIRTMQIIRELEPHPRNVYTGTMGFIRPGGEFTLNVAIRTVLLNRKTGDATFGVGGGITWDSTVHGEYEECLLKAHFLHTPRPAFRLLESLLLENNAYFLLDRHLERLKASARYFQFRIEDADIRATLESLRSRHARGTWKVRLTVDETGDVQADATAITCPGTTPKQVRLARQPVNSHDPFLCHKTTQRAVYDEAKAAAPDSFDVILWNERGEITESCIANVVAEFAGIRYTPARTCGLLAGTFRTELLARGELHERVIYTHELRRADALYLINSVRKWIPVQLLD